MNDVIEKEDIKIEDMIYEIRGVQVMLDSDLARLYKCKNGTKTLNLAVKRNIDRFPDTFMFRLSDNEYRNLKFQIETSSLENEYGGRRYNPYVFTEDIIHMFLQKKEYLCLQQFNKKTIKNVKLFYFPFFYDIINLEI